jgi:hypothetical protein
MRYKYDTSDDTFEPIRKRTDRLPTGKIDRKRAARDRTISRRAARDVKRVALKG